MTPAQRRLLWKDIHESLTTTFQAAAKERPERQGFVEDPISGFTEPAYVLFERKALWVAVNVWRASNGFEPLDIEAIERVERMACGHVDYGTKLVIYCTELALGDKDIRP